VLELFQVGISVVMFALLAVYAWRLRRAKALARGEPAVQAPVVSVVREESGGRVHSWFVDVVFEVPDRGFMKHRRGFETEGKAILWSRLHREGSVHWVVPNAIEQDQVFLLDDLKRSEWHLLALVAIVGATAAYSVYLLVVEYWLHD
jgi:hypothetical protein